jgi:hypothetical protein
MTMTFSFLLTYYLLKIVNDYILGKNHLRPFDPLIQNAVSMILPRERKIRACIITANKCTPEVKLGHYYKTWFSDSINLIPTNKNHDAVESTTGLNNMYVTHIINANKNVSFSAKFSPSLFRNSKPGYSTPAKLLITISSIQCIIHMCESRSKATDSIHSIIVYSHG